MRAVVVSQAGPVTGAVVSHIDEPSPSPGEVIVQLEASDVNYPDILYIEGRYQSSPPCPFSPGLAGAGVVQCVGYGVSKAMIGRRVLVLPQYGTYAEKVRVPAERCWTMPDAMTFEVAAALGLVYQTAYFALTDHGKITPGSKVLVLGGAGGIGMAAIQIAKALGATVIAATRGDAGRDFVLSLGADVAVDVGLDDLRNGLRTAVHRATDGHGVDIVIDPVGGPVSEASLRTLAWRGRLVVVGFASGAIPSFPGNYLLVKNITVSGIQWTDYIDRQPIRVARAQQHIFNLWSKGRLAPRIGNIIPLEGFAAALSNLSSGQHRGKTIIKLQYEEGHQIASA